MSLTIREGDRVALVGAKATALVAALTANATTISVEDASALAVNGRYLIGSEIVEITSRNTTLDTAIVERGRYSTAATHADDDAIHEVEELFHVETANSRAGWMAPLRRHQRFVILPRITKITSQEATESYTTPEEARGSYQDGGGASIVIERDDMSIQSRLGLVILERHAGGHWELGVRRL
jgi:hypothetical protein